MKKVQITEELFRKLLQYHFSDIFGYEDEELFEIERDIKRDLEKKLNALSMRSYYTQYKTAETEQEREAARKKYLDERGVPEDFRW